MKFIHCADLHLDSKLEANLTKEKVKERRNEIMLSFSKMVDFAKSNDVRVVIIAGDLFDRETVSLKTKSFVLDVIKNASDIDFLYLGGNHDSKNPFLTEELPENLKLFGDSLTSYKYESVNFTGVVLTENNCKVFYDRISFEEADYNVLTLHAGDSNTCSPTDIKISLLREKNIDYLALGHIHKNSINPLDNRGQYAYAGCLEGRGFDECGQKGFYLVDTVSRQITFHSVCSRMLFEVEVDISQTNSFGEVLAEIEKALKDIDRKNMIKVVLVGTYTLSTQKDINFIETKLNDHFYFAKIKDKTTIKIDSDSYKNDISLKGEFIRQVLKSPFSEEEKGLVISYGLKALKGEELE